MKIEVRASRLSTPSERGWSDEKITELLEAETWMLADISCRAWFADEVSETPEKQKQR